MTSEQQKFSGSDKRTGAAASPPAPWRDFNLAMGLLTRLPSRTSAETANLGGAAGFFPLAGVIVGGAMAIPILIGAQLHLPAEVTAFAAVLAAVWFTRALHEDGLADTADGLGGGRTVEQKLLIMRDSRVGTFGALALIASVGLRWVVLAALISIDAAIAALAAVAAASLSRFSPVVLMRLLPPARSDGLSFAAGRPSAISILVALATVAVVFYKTLSVPLMIGALAGLAAATGFIGALAWRHLRGQTGDVLGAAQQVSEAAILLAILVRWTA